MKYGEEQVKIWRRSYDIPPPLLKEDDPRHPKFNNKFKNIDNLPVGESLKDVIERLNPFLEKYFQIQGYCFQNKYVMFAGCVCGFWRIFALY